MLTEKEKKELLEDANNPKIRKEFQNAARAQIEWIKNQQHPWSLDRYITFLDTYQKVFGPFSIKKSASRLSNNFRL